jgi:hypothetical protein
MPTRYHLKSSASTYTYRLFELLKSVSQNLLLRDEEGALYGQKADRQHFFEKKLSIL